MNMAAGPLRPPPPTLSVPTGELYQQILTALRDGPQATPDLAEQLEADRSRIAHRCKRMEEKFELLESRLEQSDQVLYFFPVSGEVLTESSYERIMAEIARRRKRDPNDPDARVIPFHPEVRVWSLTPRGRDAVS